MVSLGAPYGGGVLGGGEDFDFAGDDTGVDEIELAGDADGDVDDAAFNEGAAVGDGDDFGATIVKIGDADFGAEAEGAVGGSGTGVAEALSGGG